MSTIPVDERESDQTLDELDVRALRECMTVVKEAPGMYLVASASGNAYTVDARGGACECPDFQWRERYCKHARRVDFARGERVIPAWVDRSKVDPLLGQHVRGPDFAPTHPEGDRTEMPSTDPERVSLL